MSNSSFAHRDTLVIDLGSYRVKCGLARHALAGSSGGDPAAAPVPPFVIPSMAGRLGAPTPRGLFAAHGQSMSPQAHHHRVHVGIDTALSFSTGASLLRVSFPVENGLLVDEEAGYRLLKQGVNAALLPGYYAARQDAQAAGTNRNTGGVGVGVRGVAAQLEEAQRSQRAERSRIELLEQVDRLGDRSTPVEGSVPVALFGAYDALAGTGSGGGGGSSDSALADEVLASYPHLRPSATLGSATSGSSPGGRYTAALVEHPFASRRQRARLAESLLETSYGTGGNPSREDGFRSRGAGAATGEAEAGHVEALFCGVAPLLTLYASGETTGVAIDVGHHVVSTAGAVNGTALTAAMQRSDGVCGGAAVTDHLRTLLQCYRGAVPHTGRGCVGTVSAFGSGSNAELRLVNHVKETCGQVLPMSTAHATCLGDGDTIHESTSQAVRYPNSHVEGAYRRRQEALLELDTAMRSAALLGNACAGDSDATTAVDVLSLPDGSTVCIPREAALQAAEAHFQPWVAGHGDDTPSVVDLLCQTLGHPSLQSHLAVRPALLSHVVLSGGATCINGFAPRVLAELQARTPAGVRVRVVAPKERGVGAWLGAAMVSQLSSFDAMCVSREEYAEAGEAALHARLFA